MNTIAINNKSIDIFFKFLSKMDTNSKKKLIIKLTESIGNSKKNKNNIKNLFGSWVDNRESDLINKEIRDSRFDNRDIIEFS